MKDTSKRIKMRDRLADKTSERLFLQWTVFNTQKPLKTEQGFQQPLYAGGNNNGVMKWVNAWIIHTTSNGKMLHTVQ